MIARFALVLVALGLVLPAPARAGQAEQAAETAEQRVTELRLKDGSILYGAIQLDQPVRVVFKTISGVEVDVKRADIASIRSARGRVVAGEFRPSDPNSTRMLFAPTARSLAKGEGYIAVYEFLLPFVQVGVTDRFSMGAGTPLVFAGDEGGRPVWLTPKYQFLRRESTALAAGVLHFAGIGTASQVGIAYVVGTTGSTDNALSAGAGWAYARYKTNTSSCTGEPSKGLVCGPPVMTMKREGSAVVMVGGERRLGRRVKFVTENYVFEGGGITSFGVRFLGDRLSADLGVFAPLIGEGFLLLPVINFVWKFGS